MVQPESTPHSFLQLNNILLDEQTTFCLSTHQLRDIGLSLLLGSCEQCCSDHSSTVFFVLSLFFKDNSLLSSKWIYRVSLVAQWQNLPANIGDVGSVPGSGRIPWRRKWQTTPVFLPEKSSLMGYSPWGHKRVRHNLATTQQQQKWIYTDDFI